MTTRQAKSDFLSVRIRCRPQSLCSWNYDLLGGSKQATIEFDNAWPEQGAIVVEGLRYRVRKEVEPTVRWSLEVVGHSHAEAIKEADNRRPFELTFGGETFALEPKGRFTRAYRLESAGEPLALMQPNHPMTRRGSIELLRPDLDFKLVAFAFWLVALMWIRESASSGSSGAGLADGP